MAYIGNNVKFNTSRYNPQSADPSNPVEGQTFYADGTSRAEGLYVYKNGAWSSVGQSSGSLSTYYSQDFEGFLVSQIHSSGNNAVFNDGGTLDGTISIETTNPIDGNQSLKYTAGAASNNDYVVIETATIFDLQRSRENGLVTEIDASNFNTDFDLVAYDETNGAVLEKFTIPAGSTVSVPKGLSFFPLNSTLLISYGLHFNNSPVNTEFILIDNVELTTDPFKFLSLSNDSETKNVGGIDFSSVSSPQPSKSSNLLRDRVLRAVDSGKVRYRYEYRANTTVPGAANGTGDLLISLPSGDSFNSDLVGFITTSTNLNDVASYVVGEGTIVSNGIANAQILAVPYDSTRFRLLFAQHGSGATGFFNASNFNLSDNDMSWSLEMVVPIEGITATSPHIVTPARSNMFDTRIVEGITIEGVTSNPTKGTTTVDQVQYSQVGDKGVFKYEYSQNTVGTNGSGDYLYSLPDDLEFADSVKRTTGAISSSEFYSSALGKVTNQNSGAAGSVGYIVPYDNTRFRIVVQIYNSTVNIKSSGFYGLGNSEDEFSAYFTVPIKGWTSTSQFLAAMPFTPTKVVQGIEIDATTTAPTKASNLEKDEIQHSRVLDKGKFKYIYRSDTTTTGAVAGSGDYIFSLPQGLQFDTDFVDFKTDDIGSTTGQDIYWRIIGTGNGVIDGIDSSVTMGIVPYDSSSFRIYYKGGGGANRFVRNDAFETTRANTGYTVEFEAPIKQYKVD